ncbi:dual specificity phosphatase 12 [Linnemannia gamsii]|uniref:protein-tyrosine-phosphatase n=1 Tax=Linnemannia gamsii TaxID=64522 RepID=A0ABQ7JYR7_9FUNG|nr:dual specificity phosphatase 12 [Linnemannia gamsii]
MSDPFSQPPRFDSKQFRQAQEILPGLFLSGALVSESREEMKELGITHIIQVTDIPTPRFPGEFIYKVIPVPDMDETNLIKHLPSTYEFIHGALKSGRKVLVHCQAGASRSVTIVCAYLMKEKKMSALEALTHIQALRQVAEPNDGFMTQLLLYAAIGYDVNVNQTAYRRFLIASDAAQREMFGYIEDMTLAADPQNAPARTAVTMTAGIQQGPLKCKKCRRALVARESVVTHTPGQGQVSFEYRKRDATLHISEAVQSDISAITPKAATVCQSYFIEPVEWIQELHGMEGKISCPKCDSKLGTFNWSGEHGYY